MFDELEKEISEIKAKYFHIVEGEKNDRALGLTTEVESSLPSSYVAFILKFGNAKLYRLGSSCQVGVISPPQEKVLSNGEKLLRIGHFDDAKAYFVCSLLQPGRESPVYEWTDEGLEKIADGFEEWLTIRCRDARDVYSEEEWHSILNGPSPFTDAEEAIVAARRQFEWQVAEFIENRVRIRVKNNSNLVLPYLTIGIRAKDPAEEGRVWESAIRLDVSDIQPGQEGVIERAIHLKLFQSADTVFFQEPDPLPEQRNEYWEFRK